MRDFVEKVEPAPTQVDYQALCPGNASRAAYWACFDRQSNLELSSLELKWEKAKLTQEEVKKIQPSIWLQRQRLYLLIKPICRNRELHWEKRAIEELLRRGVDFDFKLRADMSSLGEWAQSLFLTPTYGPAMKNLGHPESDEFDQLLDAFAAKHERWILSKSLPEPLGETARQHGARL